MGLADELDDRPRGGGVERGATVGRARTFSRSAAGADRERGRDGASPPAVQRSFSRRQAGGTDDGDESPDKDDPPRASVTRERTFSSAGNKKTTPPSHGRREAPSRSLADELDAGDERRSVVAQLGRERSFGASNNKSQPARHESGFGIGNDIAKEPAGVRRSTDASHSREVGGPHEGTYSIGSDLAKEGAATAEKTGVDAYESREHRTRTVSAYGVDTDLATANDATKDPYDVYDSRGARFYEPSHRRRGRSSAGGSRPVAHAAQTLRALVAEMNISLAMSQQPLVAIQQAALAPAYMQAGGTTRFDALDRAVEQLHGPHRNFLQQHLSTLNALSRPQTAVTAVGGHGGPDDEHLWAGAGRRVGTTRGAGAPARQAGPMSCCFGTGVTATMSGGNSYGQQRQQGAPRGYYGR